MAAEHLFLDTNLLIAATDAARAEHDDVVRAFNESWPGRGATLYTSGQVLREYLVVTTRPLEVNGLGLHPNSALANISEFRRRTTLLDETDKVAARLATLVEEHAIRGKRIHDANIVATMLTHGIRILVTLNPRDFAPYSDVIDVRDHRTMNPPPAQTASGDIPEV